MSQAGPAETVRRLVEAVNAHDLEAMVGCFAEDYVNVTPAHPMRGFGGRQQVRRNWAQLFAGVPDLHARLTGMAVDGDRVWTEWDISGTRRDGAPFAMRGVVIFGVTGDVIASARSTWSRSRRAAATSTPTPPGSSAAARIRGR
jgi:ketosteroid isomerase-like protein